MSEPSRAPDASIGSKAQDEPDDLAELLIRWSDCPPLLTRAFATAGRTPKGATTT